MWLDVVLCGCMCLYVPVCGCMWLYVAVWRWMEVDGFERSLLDGTKEACVEIMFTQSG